MVKTLLSTSIIFLMIMIVRTFFRKKAGNVFLYSLWLLFAAGLVLPVFSAVLPDIAKLEKARLESPVSVMNLVKAAPSAAGRTAPIAKQTEKLSGKGTKLEHQAEKTDEPAKSNDFFGQTDLPQLPYILYDIWAAGTVAILMCQLFSEKAFRRKLTENRYEINYHGQKLYIASGIKTPLLFRSKKLSLNIYLPETIMENETLVNHAILHENIHRKHGDIWWGYLRNVLTAVYWFDPLVWFAAILSKRDCEYACDSSVMKNMSQKERISYGNSLLSLIQVGGKQDLFCTATAMKIGKSEMEMRIRMIKNGKKRNVFSIIFILLLLCVTGCVAFTDAVETGQEPVKAQKMPSRQPEPANTLSAKEADYKLTDIWGADPPEIYYEDNKYMIFAGYFGLFVYSKETEEIVQSLNLKDIVCDATQGDDFCQIYASEDGKNVYLCVVSDAEKMYQYSVKTMELQYLDYKLPDKLYNRKKWERTNKSGIRLNGSTIGDLVYWHDDGGMLIKYEPLFYRPYGSCNFFNPEDIHDLSEASFYADGKEYVLTDEKKLNWIEKRFSNSAEKIKGAPACPFYYIMYLKRKDGGFGKIFPATDSCPVYQSSEAFYDYKEKTNESFWKLFGIQNMDIFIY